MFLFKNPAAQAVRTLKQERNVLRLEIETLEKKVRQLEHDYKLADEDIKHMVKIRQEQLEIEHEKKEVKREREYQIQIADIKDDYRDKLENHLADQVATVSRMYDKILKRLPYINVKLKGDVG